MGFARPGCRISGGSIVFDGIDLTAASDDSSAASSGARASPMWRKAPPPPSTRPTASSTRRSRPRVAPQSSNGATRPSRTPSISTAACSCPIPTRSADRYPHQVSGGQLQRAMTAMAMACRPDLIIFDEPTTALDVTTQVEVLAAIRDIVEQFSTAAIYITHDLAVVAQMADRIMVLRYGKLVEEAPTRDMLKTPQRGLHQARSGRCASSPSPDRPSDEPVLRGRRCRLRPMAAASRCSRTSRSSVPRGRTVAVVGEFGLGQVDARPRHHRPAAADRRARSISTASRCRAALQAARQGYAAPHPDDLPDRPTRRSIRARRCATSSAGRSSSISA